MLGVELNCSSLCNPLTTLYLHLHHPCKINNIDTKSEVFDSIPSEFFFMLNTTSQWNTVKWKHRWVMACVGFLLMDDLMNGCDSTLWPCKLFHLLSRNITLYTLSANDIAQADSWGHLVNSILTKGADWKLLCSQTLPGTLTTTEEKPRKFIEGKNRKVA